MSIIRRIGYNFTFLMGVWGWLILSPSLDEPVRSWVALMFIVLALSGLNWIIRDEIRNPRGRQ